MDIDLHTHSTASDGSLSPTELVREAKRNQIGIIAITDHDTTGGVKEALAAGKQEDITVIPGIEMSAAFPHDMHILGLGIDPYDTAFCNQLNELQEARQERNSRIVSRLIDLGFDITHQEVKQIAKGSIGRPHIAQVLVQKGYAASVTDAFRRYLEDGAPAYVPRTKLSPEECIDCIRSCGGKAVLAHPTSLGLKPDEYDGILDRLQDAGLYGMETYYSQFSAEQRDFFLKLAEKHRLAVTGGSDFHGIAKPHIRIGRINCGEHLSDRQASVFLSDMKLK